MTVAAVRFANAGSAPAWSEISDGTHKSIWIHGEGPIKLTFGASTPSNENLASQPIFVVDDVRVVVANTDVKVWLLLDGQRAATVIRDTVAPVETGFLIQRFT